MELPVDLADCWAGAIRCAFASRRAIMAMDARQIFLEICDADVEFKPLMLCSRFIACDLLAITPIEETGLCPRWPLAQFLGTLKTPDPMPARCDRCRACHLRCCV